MLTFYFEWDSMEELAPTDNCIVLIRDVYLMSSINFLLTYLAYLHTKLEVAGLSYYINKIEPIK